MSSGIGRTREIIHKMADYLRTKNELIEALQKNLELLSDYYVQCFKNGNGKYFGEVAVKLRLLVCKKKNNTAILMYLAQSYGFDEKYRINQEGEITDNGDGCTLEEYLDRKDFKVNVGGEMLPLSHREEILCYAEKEGAAHEDLKHPEILYKMKSPKFTVNGITIYQVGIENAARYVIDIGNRILNDIKRIANGVR